MNDVLECILVLWYSNILDEILGDKECSEVRHSKFYFIFYFLRN